MRIAILFGLFLLLGHFSFAQVCVPVLSLSKDGQSLKSFSVNTADTIDLKVSCLSVCQIEVQNETDDIQVTNLPPNQMIVKALKPGSFKIDIYANCPSNTFIMMTEGQTTDLSGRIPIDSFWIECVPGD